MAAIASSPVELLGELARRHGGGGATGPAAQLSSGSAVFDALLFKRAELRPRSREDIARALADAAYDLRCGGGGGRAAHETSWLWDCATLVKSFWILLRASFTCGRGRGAVSGERHRGGARSRREKEWSWGCAGWRRARARGTVDALVTDMRNCALIVFRATQTTRTRRKEGSIASAALRQLHLLQTSCFSERSPSIWISKV